MISQVVTRIKRTEFAVFLDNDGGTVFRLRPVINLHGSQRIVQFQCEAEIPPCDSSVQPGDVEWSMPGCTGIFENRVVEDWLTSNIQGYYAPCADNHLAVLKYEKIILPVVSFGRRFDQQRARFHGSDVEL